MSSELSMFYKKYRNDTEDDMPRDMFCELLWRHLELGYFNIEDDIANFWNNSNEIVGKA